MKLTNWFPASVKPVRVGWYEVGHSEFVHPRNRYFLTGRLRYWNGASWRAGWLLDKVSVFGEHETHRWRGISRTTTLKNDKAQK
jgi:hypothetical protein